VINAKQIHDVHTLVSYVQFFNLVICTGTYSLHLNNIAQPGIT